MLTAELWGYNVKGGPVVCGRSLASVKRRAWRAFGGGFLDHEIRIYEDDGTTQGNLPTMVSRRPLSGNRWLDIGQ